MQKKPKKPLSPKAAKTPFDEIQRVAPLWAEGVLATKDDELQVEMAQLELERMRIEEELKADQNIKLYSARLQAMRKI